MNILMNRRAFLKRSGLGILILSSSAFKCSSKKRLPNILFIVVDELGYYELSCMGHPLLETPNIDKLAQEGMRFTQMLAGGPVCAPTRACLMTGKHLGHASVRENSGEKAIRREDITIADILKQAGYATGGFGKWGLGNRGTTGVPEKHGFDLFFGYYDQVHAHTFFPAYLIRNSEEVSLKGNTGALYEGETFSHTLIFEETKKFIQDNQDRPFFCYCPWTPPHGVWGLPEDEPSYMKYKDKKWDAGYQIKEDEAQRYAAMVNMVDRQIGELLVTLKSLQLDNNTITFICGDNGGNIYFHNEKYPHGFFAPNLDPRTGQLFRGHKGLLYEGGLRIPFIVHWPGKIKAATVSEHLGYFPDVMPTLAELIKTKPPDDIDGISFLPTLLGEDVSAKRQIQHEYLYWEFRGQVAVRWGDWKAVKPEKADWELYNLEQDIGESNNQAALYPEVLQKIIAFADESHHPHIRGEILDMELCMKDHTQTKNPKPWERRKTNKN
jgi:arylsulfatase A